MNSNEFFLQHSRLTKAFKAFLRSHLSELSEDMSSAFLEMIHEEMKAVAIQLSSLTSPTDKARLIFNLVDQEIAKSSQEVPSTCSQGCSACCYMEVEVTSAEAEILSQLIRAGHKIDQERLKVQIQREVQSAEWRKGPANPQSRCVFLSDEGSCSVYDDRPVMCRRHSVTSDSRNCSIPDAPISVRYFPRVDLYISVANEQPGLEIGPLAKMIGREFFTPSK